MDILEKRAGAIDTTLKVIGGAAVGTAAIGVPSYIAHKIGEAKGSDRTKRKMIGAFSQYNQQRNKKLYLMNQLENRSIARSAFEAGAKRGYSAKQNSMNKTAGAVDTTLKAIGGTAIAGTAIGVPAYFSYKHGDAKGSDRTKRKMIGAFSQYNQQRNKKLYLMNKLENRGIARRAYESGARRGYSARGQAIQKSAAYHELAKIANPVSTLAGSFLRLGRGIKAVPTFLKRIHKPGNYMGGWSQAGRSGGRVQNQLTQGRALQQFGKHMWGTAKHSKAALGTIGGVGALGVGGTYALGRSGRRDNRRF